MRPMLCLLALGGLLSCGTPPPPAKGANVVLITLDTVRADHLGAYGYAPARTPNLDALAAEGALFETAISVAPITMPTHSSILTGTYPQTHGVRNNGGFVLGADAETLAERFRAGGYDTAAVVSAVVLDSKFGLDQGFRIYDDDLSAGPKQKMFMFKEVPASVSIDKAVALVSGELREPYFLWVHLFDAHANYEPPPPYDVIFRDQPYDGEIAYLDAELGRLFSALRTTGQEARTVVSVLADHGDSLGDHGEQTHGIFIYRSTTHVPWIVKGPGIVPSRIDGVVSQVDVAPTLTGLTGLPQLGADGLSLVDALRTGRAAPSRPGVYIESLNPRFQFGWHELRAVDGGILKYIDAPKPELYELSSDPHEATNLLPLEGSRAETLRRTLAELTTGDDLTTLTGHALDAPTASMLEALGYVGDDGAPRDGEPPDPKDVAHRWEALQICQAHVRADQLDRAMPCFLDILASDADNWTARMSYASVLRKVGRTEEAVLVLREAMSLDGRDVKVKLNLAGALLDLGKVDEGIATYRRAAEEGEDDPEPWSSLADALARLERFDEAVEAYGQALERDDRYVSAYVGLGNVFHRRGESDRGLRYLQRARELDPLNHAAAYNLGVVLDALAKPTEAQAAYEVAVSLDPDHAMTWNNLGSLHRRMGRESEAERAFRQALAADAGHVEASYNLATLLIERQPEVAAKMLMDVIARRPDLVPARHNLALVLGRLGDVDAALAQYAWLVEHTQPVGPWMGMAALEAKHGRLADARRHLALALDAGGDAVRVRAESDVLLKPLLP